MTFVRRPNLDDSPVPMDECSSPQVSEASLNEIEYGNSQIIGIIWGLIGPQRMFSGPGIYTNLQYFWLIGAVTPVILYFLAKRFPRSPLRYLNAPVIFGGLGYIPPATPLIYLSWGIVGFIFNKVIRNSKRGWWLTYRKPRRHSS